MNINPLTKWLYIGGEEGFDFVHTIVEVDIKSNPKMPQIMSWSDVFQDDTYDGEPDLEMGHVWWGPLNRFLKQFVPLGDVDPTNV